MFKVIGVSGFGPEYCNFKTLESDKIKLNFSAHRFNLWDDLKSLSGARQCSMSLTTARARLNFYINSLVYIANILCHVLSHSAR